MRSKVVDHMPYIVYGTVRGLRMRIVNGAIMAVNICICTAVTVYGRAAALIFTTIAKILCGWLYFVCSYVHKRCVSQNEVS